MHHKRRPKPTNPSVCVGMLSGHGVKGSPEHKCFIHGRAPPVRGVDETGTNFRVRVLFSDSVERMPLIARWAVVSRARPSSKCRRNDARGSRDADRDVRTPSKSRKTRRTRSALTNRCSFTVARDFGTTVSHRTRARPFSRPGQTPNRRPSVIAYRHTTPLVTRRGVARVIFRHNEEKRKRSRAHARHASKRTQKPVSHAYDGYTVDGGNKTLNRACMARDITPRSLEWGMQVLETFASSRGVRPTSAVIGKYGSYTHCPRKHLYGYYYYFCPTLLL